MAAGLSLVIRRAWGRYRLHRLEANIQPKNHRFIALVKRLGFAWKGYRRGISRSPAAGAISERWALTVEVKKDFASARERGIG